MTAAHCIAITVQFASTYGLEELRRAVQDARVIKGDGLGRLRIFLQQYAEIIMNDFGRCVIRTADEALSKESALRFRELKNEIDREMRTLIRAGIKDQSIARGDVKVIAFTLAGALAQPQWKR
jgi:hypothetical protein